MLGNSSIYRRTCGSRGSDTGSVQGIRRSNLPILITTSLPVLPDSGLRKANERPALPILCAPLSASAQRQPERLGAPVFATRQAQRRRNVFPGSNWLYCLVIEVSKAANRSALSLEKVLHRLIFLSSPSAMLLR